MADGKVKVFAGDGRGKSSAAIGIALRESLNGKKCIVIQFLKGRGLADSELLHRLERYIYLGDDRQILHRFCRGKEIHKPEIL